MRYILEEVFYKENLQIVNRILTTSGQSAIIYEKGTNMRWI